MIRRLDVDDVERLHRAEDRLPGRRDHEAKGARVDQPDELDSPRKIEGVGHRGSYEDLAHLHRPPPGIELAHRSHRYLPGQSLEPEYALYAPASSRNRRIAVTSSRGR